MGTICLTVVPTYDEYDAYNIITLMNSNSCVPDAE